jgi:hypothetical protein
VNGRPTGAQLLPEALAELLRPIVSELVAGELERLGALPARVDWLTVEEYAEAMRTTPAAIRKRIERGRVAGAVREGKRWLIPAAAVAAATLTALENEGRAPLTRPRPGTRR